MDDRAHLPPRSHPGATHAERSLLLVCLAALILSVAFVLGNSLDAGPGAPRCGSAPTRDCRPSP